MKGIAPVLGAGGTFAGLAIVGLAVGAVVDQRTASQFYALLGLFIGMALGGYGAFRLLTRSL
jgi:hypothetical protein